MSTKELANSASESEKWALKQRLLKTKSEVFSLKSQLYKALAFYEEEKHSLKLQLNSLYEDLNALKKENEGLRSSLNHSQADLETFRKQERWDSIRRMQEIHHRRKVALQHHRQEFDRAHCDDTVPVAAENEKLGEDEIDGTLRKSVLLV
jgi:regulator of replication initiation timing